MALEATTKVPVERLRLDRANPRLDGEVAEASDERIIARLYRSAELDELLQSISANGYLDIEPLVVMRDGDDDGLIVLEGNRRLATLRLLREPVLVSRIAAAESTRIAVPEIDDQVRQTLNEVSVYLVAKSGAGSSLHRLQAHQRSAEMGRLRQGSVRGRLVPEGTGGRDRPGTDRAGHRRSARHHQAHGVGHLRVGTGPRGGLFDIEDRLPPKFNFSHLYTALSRSQYMDYLGLEAAWSRHDPTPDQVPQDRLARLEQVLVWIYGSKADDVAPVVHKQNPDIKRLGEVLAHAEGRHVLEQSGDLDQAHASTESVDTHCSAVSRRPAR